METLQAIDARAYTAQLVAQTKKRLTEEQFKTAASFTDKTEINKYVFSLPETQEQFDSSLLKPIEDLLTSKINETINAEVTLRERNIATLARKWQDHTDTANSYLRDLMKERMSLEVYRPVGHNLTEKVAKILENPFYSFKGVSNNRVEFITNEVVVSHKNASAGLDMAVNLGRFTLRWEPQGNSILVSPHSNNTLACGYFHPHVGLGGDICLGNGSQAYREGLVAGDMKRVFIIVQSILQNYNSDSPFIGLHRFYWKQRRALLDFSNDVTQYALLMANNGSRVRMILDPSKSKYSLLGDNRYVFTDSGAVYQYRDDLLNDHGCDEDDERIAQGLLCSLYFRKSVEKGLRVDDQLYCKSTNGRYVKYEEDAVIASEYELPPTEQWDE